MTKHRHRASACSPGVPDKLFSTLAGCGILGILLTGTSSIALAQVVANPGVSLPSSINPGRVPQQLPPPPAVQEKPQFEFQGAPEERQLPPQQAKKITFRLSSVQISGGTIYPAGTFESLYGSQKSRVISLSEVYDWVNTITKRYREDGYILSRAVVPAQRIANGVVKITVIEGFIDKVKVQGDTSTRLEGYGLKIAEERPLRSSVLERYLLLANELPGLSVRSVLAPSPTVPGAADLTLVATRKTFDASLQIDDHGTRYLGPWQDSVSLGLNDVLGYDERLTFRYAGVSSLRELSLFDLSGTLPINDIGTSLLLEGTRTRGRPGYLLAPLDPRTRGDSITLGIQHAWIRSRLENLTAGLTFTYQASSTYLGRFGLDRVPSSDDKISAIRASASYNLLDTWNGSDIVSGELSHGLPIFNASRDDFVNGRQNASRINGRAEFTKLIVSASRLQSFADHYGVLLAFTGQKATNSLLSPEQFGVGGAQFGRGYDPSEITGDDGVAGKIELQDNLQFTVYELPRLVQLYAFYDIGMISNRLAVQGQPGTVSLASAGFGARFNLADGILSSLEFAKPLTRPVAADVGNSSDPKSIRFYYSLLLTF